MMDTTSTPVAVIGGTGVYDPAWLEGAAPEIRPTPYGDALLTRGNTGGRPVVFLNRHGPGHRLPPHRVNYRANLWALARLGVRHVVATTAVGSLRPAVAPGTLVFCDQFLDFTKSRTMTFYDGGEMGVVHTDMTAPYCAGVRGLLMEQAQALHLAALPAGTYVATEGPRFESAAEVRMLGALGGDVVGMTGVPEVVLARELGLHYATVSIVTNLGAGLSASPLTHAEVTALMDQMGEAIRRLLAAVLPKLGDRPCMCQPASGPFPYADWKPGHQ
jgi:5'-methylthioadenosine phosphorylase